MAGDLERGSSAAPAGGDLVVDPSGFRQVLGHFATGVAVLTAMEGDDPIGFTAQSLTSLSLDPPLVVVCPARTSRTWPRIRAGGAFCANVLAEDQEHLARVFATPGAERFEGVGWRPSSATGSPVLDAALAWVDCRVEAEHGGGDHLVVVARVVDLGTGRPAGPLLFYRGGYRRLDPS